MKQLLILSGKGGTGKTTVASAFIRLLDAKAFADCDVDAPNLHLVSHFDHPPQVKDYYGLDKAHINSETCISCGQCVSHCRFDAIEVSDIYKVNPYLCEGCAVCEMVCPTKAIEMKEAVDGHIDLYRNHSTFSTAQLKTGSGNSGLLVTEVKKQLEENTSADIAIIDGSPGIGCPVIASLNAIDLTLIVTEPSLSGISDMKRIITTAKRFETKIAVCVNKYDNNLQNTKAIETFCKENDLSFTGRIPFDKKAIQSINTSSTIVDIDCISGTAVKDVFQKTLALL